MECIQKIMGACEATGDSAHFDLVKAKEKLQNQPDGMCLLVYKVHFSICSIFHSLTLKQVGRQINFTMLKPEMLYVLNKQIAFDHLRLQYNFERLDFFTKHVNWV